MGYGLLAATAAADLGSVVMAFSLDKEEKNQRVSGKEKEQTSIGSSLSILRHPKAILFVAALSIFSIAWLLINFFYVEKMAACGLPVEWLSAVILIYSAVQMLSEPILEKLSSGAKKRDKRMLMAVTSIVAGVAFLAFGMAEQVALILPLMCILPYYSTCRNTCCRSLRISSWMRAGHADNRAATLSVLNIGVNLLEILTLSVSAFLTKIGIWWCFLLIGVLLCLVALFFVKKSR